MTDSLTKGGFRALVALTLLTALFASPKAYAECGGTPIVSTDKADYSATETALISGSGFNCNETLSVLVTAPDGTIRDGSGTGTHGPESVTTDGDGNFVLNYKLFGTDPDAETSPSGGAYAGQSGEYTVEVKDAGGTILASHTFTDASQLANPVPSSVIVSYLGLEWVWASPCAQNGCTSGILVGKDGFRYATAAEWNLKPHPASFGNTKCAAPWFDQSHNHCDWTDPSSGYYGSAVSGGFPAGPTGNTSMNYYGETWLVRTASVNNPPTVNAGGSYTGNEGASIALNNATASDPENNPLTFSWTVNSPLCTITNATQLSTATVTCADNGNYTVTLTANDGTNPAVSSSAPLTVNNVVQQVQFAPAVSVPEGSAFTGSGSVIDPGTDTFTGIVGYGDGSGLQSLTISPTNTFSLNHTYPESGTFTIVVATMDEDGYKANGSLPVTITNVAPSVNTGLDGSIPAGASFVQSGSFTDPGADTWTATVNYGDGSGVQPLTLNPDKTFALNHLYTNPGFFVVTVTVSDDDGAVGIDTLSVTVINEPPRLNSFGTYIGNEGDSITLNPSFSDPENDPLTFTWTMSASQCSITNATSPTPTVTCSNNGNFTINYTVSDGLNTPVSDSGYILFNNVAPTATLGNDGPVNIGAPATISFTDPFDPSSKDTIAGFRYAFSCSGASLSGENYYTAGISSATTCTFPSSGLYTVTGRIIDQGSDGTEYSTVVEVKNAAPVIDAGSAYSGIEGHAIALSGATATDAENDALTYAWTIDSALCSFSNAAVLNPSVTCTDNGNFSATLTVSDGVNPAVVDTAGVVVANVAPELGALTVPMAPQSISTPVTGISASFTDAGASDTHTCTVDYGDGSGTHTSNAVGGVCTAGAHTYAEAGVYTVSMTVTDDDGAADSSTSETLVVIFDPSAGFVTGGGWINSPAGAFKADESLTGKASFGFVSKYKKGANVPTGNTEFQFKTAGLNFNSTSYEWLVVNQGGTNAQYKGEGQINGAGTYKFMLWANDGAPDTFRIQITEQGGGIVYDNGFDQAIGGGSIVIHTK